MLMHQQSANPAKAKVAGSRRPVVVAQARLATRRRGVTLQRLEGGSAAVQEPVYADSFTSTSNRRPSRISDSVVVPSRTFPALISFPSITQQDAGQMASIIKHELLSHSEALIVVNGSEALMTAMESMCTTNKLLISEGRNMQVSIKPRSLGEEGFKEGNFVLEASLGPSSFPAVGAHLDAPARFNPRRAASLASDILAHSAVLMTCIGESAIESALMTLALARSRLESEEPGAELTVMVKPFGDEIAAAATGYALYISRVSARTPPPSSLARSAPSAPAPRSRAPSPARRGAAWRLAQEFGSSSSTPSSTPSYSSSSAAPATRSASPARKGAAWRLAQMADSSAPAPAASRATSTNEREQRSVTPTRRRGGIAARFGADTAEPASYSTASPSYSTPTSSSSSASSGRAVSRGRVRRGGAAARFGADESPVAEEPRVVERRPAREASPARRRGGIAARFGL